MPNRPSRERTVCEDAIEQLGLEMTLVEFERLFGGERVVVYYLAENRVDFRELVRLLAAEFQTRVEMRQIGVRDEAKLLADFGDCGKETCCNSHLHRHPARLHADGQDAAGDAGPDEDFRPLRPAEVLLALRIRSLRTAGTALGGAGRTAGLSPRQHPRRPARNHEWKLHARSRHCEALEEDRRYPLEAYIFVFEALNFAHEVLGLGIGRPASERTGRREEEEETGSQRHVTGQELCEAIRQFALEQYGYMAKLVLSNWGMHARAISARSFST